MKRTWLTNERYRKQKQHLLRTEGECVQCGETERLEYHHVNPVATHGVHGRGVLLCRDCHRAETTRQRNMHKAIGADGWPLNKSIRRYPPRKTAVDRVVALQRRRLKERGSLQGGIAKERVNFLVAQEFTCNLVSLW